MNIGSPPLDWRLKTFLCVSFAKHYQCNACNYITVEKSHLVHHVYTEHLSDPLDLVQNPELVQQVAVCMDERVKAMAEKIRPGRVPSKTPIIPKILDPSVARSSNLTARYIGKADVSEDLIAGFQGQVMSVLNHEEHESSGEESPENDSEGEVQDAAEYCEVAHAPEPVLDDAKVPMAKGAKGKLPCGKCKRVFSKEYYLLQHRAKVHGEEIPCFKEWVSCNVCDKQFATSRSLMNHMDKVHSKAKEQGSFPCTICGVKFTEQASLQIHQENIHQMEFADETENNDQTEENVDDLNNNNNNIKEDAKQHEQEVSFEEANPGLVF